MVLKIWVRTLRDHLDVDVVFSEHAEEAAGYANHILQLLAYQAHNSHIRDDVNGTQGTKLADGAIQVFVLDAVLVFATAAQQCGFRVKGHGDMDLGRGDQIHRKVPAVQNAEDVHQEAVGAGTLVGVDV